MNLNKDIIRETKVKCTNTIQITLDDDYNVPDSKGDIDTIIKEQALVVHDDVRASGERAEVAGTLKFSLLYMSARGVDGRHMPVKMTGEMPFRENVNLSQAVDGAYCSCKAVIDDLSIKAINSRKISVRAIVSFIITCENVEDVMAAVELADPEEQEESMVQILKRRKEFAQVALQLKDNLRIRSNISLPAEKPEVGEIIWEDIDVRNMSTRLTDAGITISGELSIFVMYMPVDESLPVQWYDTMDTFEENLDVSGCNPDLIGYIHHHMISTNVEIKPDYDGENREISVELVMSMDIKAYEICQKDFMEDIYSPVSPMKVHRTEETLYELLIHNNSKCRANGQQKIDAQSRILQICNCTGTIQVDNMEMEEDGLMVDGAILANVFYITDDDNSPMGSVKLAIPFSDKVMVKVEKEKIPNVEYQVNTGLSQLTAVMTGTGTVEMKAMVSVDVLCFMKSDISLIDQCQVEEEPENEESGEYMKFPTMIGFISDGTCRIWDIAKKYHTTTSSVRQMNPQIGERMDDYVVKRGEKLLLVKSAKR